MRRFAVLAAAAAGGLALAASALAHPLGNFTVNQYSRVQPSGDRVYVLYALDLAEIPTFQAAEELRSAGEERYAAALADRIRDGLTLEVGGAPLALRELDRRIAFPAGVGGLPTTRLEIVFEAGPVPRGQRLALAYLDESYPDRIGWKEVVLAPDAGARALSASVPATSVSDELRAYPEDLLRSPLDVRAATAEIVTGGTAGPPPPLSGDGPGAPGRGGSAAEGGFAKLIEETELTAGVVALSLFVAMFWGAAHALSPGHGKAIVAAYLVGSRGTPRHAIYLGLITTVTHTVGVFALGLVTLALSELIVPERLYPWLNLVAAVLVVAVGAAVLRSRIREWRRAVSARRGRDRSHERGGERGFDAPHPPPVGPPGAGVWPGEARRDRRRHVHSHGHDRDHAHGHSHGHDHHHPDHRHRHAHRHVPEPGTGWRGLLAVGVSGGLIPCPTALVVLLAAISLQRIGYGLVLIVAFSVGLAATMTAIGLLAVFAKRAFRRLDLQGPVVRLLPAVSALVILAVGVAMTVRALPALA